MRSDGGMGGDGKKWPFTQKGFVWAIGPSGRIVADLLADLSVPVLLLSSGTETRRGRGKERAETGGRVIVLRGEKILRIDGHFGQFRIRIQGADGSVTDVEAGFVLIAGETPSPGSSLDWVSVPKMNTLTIEEIEAWACSGGGEGIPRSVGLWLDPIEGLPDRVAAERALRALLHAREKGKADCYVLHRHIPLWGLNGQSLYDDMRGKGVRFLRLGSDWPECRPAGGKVLLEVEDQTIAGQTVSLSLDRILLVGQPSPTEGAAEIACRVGDPLDTEGFLQKDNVHLYPSRSFRKGIYYVGSCKGEQAQEELAEEVGAILPEVIEPILAGEFEAAEGIRIDRGHCVSCLTCYRACPHHALDISQGPVPVPLDPACQGCGLCAALCPGNAIELVQRPTREILGELEGADVEGDDSSRTVVFCCRRSGIRPAGAEGPEVLSVPPRTAVIEVPCACSVSEEMLLEAFLKGAGKVVVVGCHPDNCVSQSGSTVGQRRTQRVANTLADAGRDPGECIRFVVVAPNESHRLSCILRGDDQDLEGRREKPALVPSRGGVS